MDKVKKVYIDSRYKASDSMSNSGFKLEVKEGLDLPDNTICYIDDISIPLTWFTIETYNNQLYIETTNNSITDATVITLPNGNYTASSLAVTLTLLLQARFPEIGFSCNYNNSVRTIEITSSSGSPFRILAGDTVVSLPSNGWYSDGGHHVYSPDINNLRSVNEVFRNSVQLPSGMFSESGFIDLLNVHNIYIHSPNLGHYNFIGVRSESSIVKY